MPTEPKEGLRYAFREMRKSTGGTSMFVGSSLHKLVRIVLALSICFGAAPRLGLAQTATGITGNVTDPTGAVVPGVTITLTNKATAATRTALTNETGTYSVPQLSP